jgi:hypothetical protein
MTKIAVWCSSSSSAATTYLSPLSARLLSSPLQISRTSRPFSTWFCGGDGEESSIDISSADAMVSIYDNFLFLRLGFFAVLGILDLRYIFSELLCHVVILECKQNL